MAGPPAAMHDELSTALGRGDLERQLAVAGGDSSENPAAVDGGPASEGDFWLSWVAAESAEQQGGRPRHGEEARQPGLGMSYGVEPRVLEMHHACVAADSSCIRTRTHRHHRVGFGVASETFEILWALRIRCVYWVRGDLRDQRRDDTTACPGSFRGAVPAREAKQIINQRRRTVARSNARKR